MQEYELNAELREDAGKGASRRLRRTGRIPGVIYGTNKEAQSISLSHDDLTHQLERESFYSSILTMRIDGRSEKVVLKDLHRHPFKPNVLHVDFLRIDEDQKITMRVPLHFINEDKCIGVKTGGGVISHVMTELEISCLPRRLPEYINVDIENMNVGESMHLGDITLPPGVEIYALQHGGDASRPVVSVNIPKVVEEGEAAEELEGVDGSAEGEAAPGPAEDSGEA